MSVAKVIEVTSESKIGIEDAVQAGLNRIAESANGIQGAWVSDIKVRTSPSGQIDHWRVCMRVSFVVE
ncbi:dodecin family protein [Novilysobacter selenitireducens]|uniref:Dodecin family protein n=1 Tax=Novilysobacter selenitireducens TaxID=2872639 RepID=A0ABS7T846_9GAMM|nr:dodecin family protein [Lysobacter selenitireducens]MBZ4040020.1 dodecin family protein [Lysobacter selenitireducens]